MPTVHPKNNVCWKRLPSTCPAATRQSARKRRPELPDQRRQRVPGMGRQRQRVRRLDDGFWPHGSWPCSPGSCGSGHQGRGAGKHFLRQQRKGRSSGGTVSGGCALRGEDPFHHQRHRRNLPSHALGPRFPQTGEGAEVRRRVPRHQRLRLDERHALCGARIPHFGTQQRRDSEWL